MIIDDDEGFDDIGDLYKSDVFEETNIEQLYAWHKCLFDMFDHIQSKIEAFNAAGIAEAGWVTRAAGKVAYAKMAIRWCERRLAELDADIPPTRDGQDKKTIRRLRGELREARAEICRLTGQQIAA